MDTKELYEKLKTYFERHPREKPYEVVVLLDKPSVGARAHTEIKGAYCGMDWERNLFLISPKIPLVPKSTEEAIWEDAIELLLHLATKDGKRASLETKNARAIFKRAGIDYMEYAGLFHEKKDGKNVGNN